MIKYECDKCKQPIAGRGGVATITAEAKTSDPLRLEFCKQCVREMLPETEFEEHPKHAWLQTMASWMNDRDESD